MLYTKNSFVFSLTQETVDETKRGEGQIKIEFSRGVCKIYFKPFQGWWWRGKTAVIIEHGHAARWSSSGDGTSGYWRRGAFSRLWRRNSFVPFLFVYLYAYTSYRAAKFAIPSQFCGSSSGCLFIIVFNRMMDPGSQLQSTRNDCLPAQHSLECDKP